MDIRANSPQEIVNIFNAQHKQNINSALLVANPVPAKSEISKDKIDKYIDSALKECTESQIVGKTITPFLLQKIVELTQGKSLSTNIALALNNVQLATEIAKVL